MKKSTLLLLLIPLFLWSCGLFDDDSADDGTIDHGTGSITIEGKTWDFQIHACTIRPDGSFSLMGAQFPDKDPPLMEVHLRNHLPFEDSPAFSHLVFSAGDGTSLDYQYGTDPDEDENLGDYFQLDGNTITANPPMFLLKKPGYTFDPEEGIPEVESSLTATCKNPSSGILSPR